MGPSSWVGEILNWLGNQANATQVYHKSCGQAKIVESILAMKAGSHNNAAISQQIRLVA
jgi:hypothetical protein